MRFFLFQQKLLPFYCHLLLLTFILAGCISSTDRAVIEPWPTTVYRQQTPEEHEQFFRRQKAQRLAAQAELALNQGQEATFDLPLLLAREAVLTTWSTDGYVTVEADRTLRHILLMAMADPALSGISKHFPAPSIFSVNHGAADTLDAAITPDGRVLAIATNDDGMGPVNSIFFQS